MSARAMISAVRPTVAWGRPRVTARTGSTSHSVWALTKVNGLTQAASGAPLHSDGERGLFVDKFDVDLQVKILLQRLLKLGAGTPGAGAGIFAKQRDLDHDLARLAFT